MLQGPLMEFIRLDMGIGCGTENWHTLMIILFVAAVLLLITGLSAGGNRFIHPQEAAVPLKAQ